MREALDQWDFVIAAYAVTGAALTFLLAWSWQAMRQMERRRDAARQEGRRR